MTVNNQTKKVTASGNGSATSFSFSPMVINANDELEVVIVTAAGVETAISRGTGANAYAVSVTVFPGTGSITYPEDEVTPLPAGQDIVIKRVLVLEQDVDLQNQGAYFADVQETQVEDKHTMRDLQQQELLDRCMKVPVSDTASLDIPDVSVRANKVCAWNGAGDVIATSSGAAVTDLSSHTVTPTSSSTSRTMAAVSSDIPIWCGSGGGSGDAATLTGTAVQTAYITGKIYRYLTTATNTVINPTANVDSIGAKTIKSREGYPLVVGIIPVGFIMELLYDGTDLRAMNLPMSKTYIEGLDMSNGTDAVNDIDIAAGTCQAGDGAYLTFVAATRALDAVYAEGGPGFRDSATNLTGAKWFHIYAIGDPAKTNDFFATTDVTPSLPTGFSVSRRIGSIYWNGSTIVAFHQSGNQFLLDVPVEDVNDTNPGTSAVLSALTVPLGLTTRAIMSVFLLDSTPASGTACLVSSPKLTDTAPSGIRTVQVSIAYEGNQVYMDEETNTSSQIRYRLSQSTADHIVLITTFGWIDYRGQ